MELRADHARVQKAEVQGNKDKWRAPKTVQQEADVVSVLTQDKLKLFIKSMVQGRDCLRSLPAASIIPIQWREVTLSRALALVPS